MAAANRRWVIKVGSNLVCSGGPLLQRAWMQQVLSLKRDGLDIIWVTSGAIATAIDRTGFSSENRTLAEKQALSAIGQPSLMDLYNLSLNSVGLKGAQILLTYSDMSDDTRRTNLQNTLEKLIEWNVVPILNENDAVATEEIKFGDNDMLSARVAVMMKAERLVLMTDVEGYLADPKEPGAKPIPELRAITDEILGTVAQSAGSKSGTGGMYSKLTAAREASRGGVTVSLVKGDLPNVLVRLANNEKMGTMVIANG